MVVSIVTNILCFSWELVNGDYKKDKTGTVHFVYAAYRRWGGGRVILPAALKILQNSLVAIPLISIVTTPQWQHPTSSLGLYILIWFSRLLILSVLKEIPYPAGCSSLNKGESLPAS